MSAPLDELAEADRWLAALREAAGDGEAPAGRVLRVKPGYNPNSSSVGSVVSVLFWGASASAVAVNLVAALLQKRARAKEADEP